MSNERTARLDAVETMFFKRQLEQIDRKLFEAKHPKYKARGFIPTQPDLDPDLPVYTYRMFDTVGKARVAGPGGGNDAPRASASGAEASQHIHNLIASYSYTLWEIRTAQKTGTPLDQMRANAARRAIEELVDEFLAFGSTAYGLSGLLKLSNTSSVTSEGTWGTLATADPDKLISDLLRTASKGVEATDEAFNKFMLVLPLNLYNLASQLRISANNNTTVLQYVKATSPFITDVQPWYRCEANATLAAIDSTHDMLCAFPQDTEVVSALVPRELEFLQPEARNYEHVINGHASCGGVVCRYPKAITYCSIVTS
jgi:hypothetical protein